METLFNVLAQTLGHGLFLVGYALPPQEVEVRHGGDVVVVGLFGLTAALEMDLVGGLAGVFGASR